MAEGATNANRTLTKLLGIQPLSHPKTPNRRDREEVESSGPRSPAQRRKCSRRPHPQDRQSKVKNVGDLSDLSAQLELGKKINLEVNARGKTLKLSTELRSEERTTKR
jgi:hypothetical protein